MSIEDIVKLTEKIKINGIKYKQTISLSIHAFKRINLFLKITFVLSLIILFNYEARLITLIWVNRFTTAFSTVSIQIISSYVTGFIFYFFIEIIRQDKKRIFLFRSFNNHVSTIYKRTQSLLTKICTASNQAEMGTLVSKPEFYKYCDNLKIHTTPVKVWFYPESNFKDFVLRICEDVKTNTDDLLNYLDFLDDNWIKHLSNINNDIYFIKANLDLNGEQSTLDLVVPHIWNLYFETKKLNILVDKYFLEYYKENKIQDPISLRRTDNGIFEVAE